MSKPTQIVDCRILSLEFIGNSVFNTTSHVRTKLVVMSSNALQNCHLRTHLRALISSLPSFSASFDVDTFHHS